MTDDPMREHQPDPALVLRRYLAQGREALWWKLEGLGERDARRPLTPTGTSLLGIVKHCANVELGYFGPTFGRPWPHGAHPVLVPFSDYDDDPQVDWVVEADVSTSDVVAFHRLVGTFVDETLTELPLDTVGRVPWWPEDRATTTLHRIAVHVVEDMSRHAGQADVLREGLDGAAGLTAASTNLPEDHDWPAYVARLQAIADRFAD